MDTQVSDLTSGDKDDLIRWFTRRMTPADRHALMAERPVTYATLHPGVSPDYIVVKVRAALHGGAS